MLKKWKKMMIVLCATAVFIIMPGMTVFGDELLEDLTETTAEYPAEVMDSISEVNDNAILQDSFGESDYAEYDDINKDCFHEVVGAGGYTVGDGVTAIVDEVSGEVELYSNNGTLWNGWYANTNLRKDEIVSIKVMSGTVFYLSMQDGCLRTSRT